MCYFCNIKGHLAILCCKRQASVHEIAQVHYAGFRSATVLSVQVSPTSPKDLCIPVVIGAHIDMSLLVDTGVIASLLMKKDFNRLFALKHRLLQTSTQLQNFSRHRIPVLGCFHMDVQQCRKQVHVTFYVTAYGTFSAIQQLELLQISGATLTCCLATALSSQLPALVPPGFGHLFGGARGHVEDCPPGKEMAGHHASVYRAASATSGTTATGRQRARLARERRRHRQQQRWPCCPVQLCTC